MQSQADSEEELIDITVKPSLPGFSPQEEAPPLKKPIDKPKTVAKVSVNKEPAKVVADTPVSISNAHPFVVLREITEATMMLHHFQFSTQIRNAHLD